MNTRSAFTITPAAEYACPACGAQHSAHTGQLFQPDPDGPRFDEPVELRRCLSCGHRFRADGAPYDEDAQIARWRAHHTTHPDLYEQQHHPRTELLPRKLSRRQEEQFTLERLLWPEDEA